MPARLAAALLTLSVLLASPASAQPSDFDLQAHRGGRGETTEESLRAFAKAIELGVSTLELDIAITKDGQPLVWHDPTIDAENAPTRDLRSPAIRSIPTSASWCTS